MLCGARGQPSLAAFVNWSLQKSCEEQPPGLRCEPMRNIMGLFFFCLVQEPGREAKFLGHNLAVLTDVCYLTGISLLVLQLPELAGSFCPL